MPDVQEPSVTFDPITAVGVVASKNAAPEHYHVVGQTADGGDADLWKDGIFKSKVTRYLCFSHTHSPGTAPGEMVLVEVKLLDVKDALPTDYTLIQTTMDTHSA
ncbi:multivesicular body subunit 12Bb [Engraulis encrasicolus]|uniref:multivesicular body subunit 12Bb n=1 Tax=Engraulis encrasicolus TaxID=184585 RepID=UPI002FD1AE48